MKTITLKTEDHFFNKVSNLAKELHLSKSELIRRAIADYEKSIHKKVLKSQIKEASMRVRKSNALVVESLDDSMGDGLDNV